MKIELLTIFPEMFESFLSASIIGRAREAGLLDIHATDIRPYSQNKHKNTDDYPFGGGAGMLMLAQPIVDAMKAVTRPPVQGKRIYTSPRGMPLTQALAQQLSQEEQLVILCGHYEGVDQRVLDKYIDMEISVGDYVLTGGELAAAIITDAVVRIIPGVIGDEQSALSDSFQDNLLAPPVYTRPAEYKGWRVPDVLLSGHQRKIEEWRLQQAQERTARLRPDLLR